MDRGTIIGLFLGVAFIAGAVLLGPVASAFWNPAAVLIVLGGTFASTIARFPFDVFQAAILVTRSIFVRRERSVVRLVHTLVELSRESRRGGLLSLQHVKAEDPFLEKAVDLAVDGADAGFIENVLRGEIAANVESYERGERVFRSMGQVAPAFGMIGTLIGLVQMLAQMDDPSKIGTSMAVAILTTLYGAALAYVLFLPIADKLSERAREDWLHRELIVQGILSIMGGYHPHLVERHLLAMITRLERGIVPAPPLRETVTERRARADAEAQAGSRPQTGRPPGEAPAARGLRDAA